MTVYFGRPGAQISIPDPRGGVQSTRGRPTSKFETGNGGMRASRLLDGRRQYTLNWQQLWYETYAQIEGFYHGHEGPGPFALHDPGRINLLTVNQSSATSHRNDTNGFTVAGSGCNISSSATGYHRGPRALQWNFTFAVSGSVTLDTPTAVWPGIPCISGQALCFSAYGIGWGSTDPTVTAAARLTWYNSAGTVLSTSTGSTISTTAGAWQQFYVTASPPAGAVYVRCSVAVTGTLAGAALHLDEFQLEVGSLPTAWRPGTGVFPVSVMSLTEQWPWAASDYRQNPILVLQEVGP